MANDVLILTVATRPIGDPEGVGPGYFLLDFRGDDGIELPGRVVFMVDPTGR